MSIHCSNGPIFVILHLTILLSFTFMHFIQEFILQNKYNVEQGKTFYFKNI